MSCHLHTYVLYFVCFCYLTKNNTAEASCDEQLPVHEAASSPRLHLFSCNSQGPPVVTYAKGFDHPTIFIRASCSPKLTCCAKLCDRTAPMIYSSNSSRHGRSGLEIQSSLRKTESDHGAEVHTAAVHSYIHSYYKCGPTYRKNMLFLCTFYRSCIVLITCMNSSIHVHTVCEISDFRPSARIDMI